MTSMINSAAQAEALFAANTMNAAFNDAAAALRALNNITVKAKQDVDNLASQVNSWNKFASVGAAMATCVGSILTMNPIGILTSADAVAVAISGTPGAKADPQDPQGI